ncbi:MAG: Xaa-Pro peptidase family protein [Acidobacteriota bacterium]
MIPRRTFLTLSGLSFAATGFVRRLLAQEAPQTQEKIENLVAGVKPLERDDYAARAEKARRLLSDNNMDGLFLIGGTDMLYFTGLNMWVSERLSGVVLNRKRSPIWVIPAFELEREKERIPTGDEIRTWEEHESPYAVVAGIMRDLGAPGGRLALGPAVRSFMFFRLRQDAERLELVDGLPVTQGCRAVKSEKEIAFMDLANKITKHAYREAFSQLREGMRPEELDGAIEAAHKQIGVDGGSGAQFAQSTAFPHGSKVERTLRPGDVIMVDGGCAVEGYHADVTRTIVFGEPKPAQRALWEIVRRAQVAALRAARPGVPCDQVDAAARKVIDDAGYGPGYKHFAHRLGHGIGLDGHEYPYLVKGNLLKLEPGMTFSDEPGIYTYGEYGVRIEDCFVVTEDGGRVLGGMEATAMDRPFE